MHLKTLQLSSFDCVSFYKILKLIVLQQFQCIVVVELPFKVPIMTTSMCTLSILRLNAISFVIIYFMIPYNYDLSPHNIS